MEFIAFYNGCLCGAMSLEGEMNRLLAIVLNRTHTYKDDANDSIWREEAPTNTVAMRLP